MGVARATASNVPHACAVPESAIAGGAQRTDNVRGDDVDTLVTLDDRTNTSTAPAVRPARAPGGISIALAGSGGSGVMTAGTLLLEAAAQAGCYGLMVRTSGPQIRGG